MMQICNLLPNGNLWFPKFVTLSSGQRFKMIFQVQDLLNESVNCVHPETPIDEVVHLILSNGISQVFVVNSDRQLLGVVSDYEILKSQLCGDLKSVIASQLMNCQVETIESTQSLQKAASRLRLAHLSQLAVTKNGRLVGLLSRQSVIRMMRLLESANHPEAVDSAVNNRPTTPQTTEIALACTPLRSRSNSRNTESPNKPAFLRQRKDSDALSYSHQNRQDTTWC